MIGVAALPVSQTPADTLRYVFLTQGNPAGEQTVWRDGENTIHAHFEFNNRGRGPLVDTRIVLNDAGLPVRIDGAGNDYFKVPVEEHFSVPEESAILVRALLATPDRRLSRLPGG